MRSQSRHIMCRPTFRNRTARWRGTRPRWCWWKRRPPIGLVSGTPMPTPGPLRLIKDTLAEVVKGREAMDVPACWAAMLHEIRNLGRPGIVSTAVSAVDAALWDLKARLLNLPLVRLLGAAHAGVPVYGSGGFTSYSIDQLKGQLGGWAAEGIPRVKMKVGTRAVEGRGSSQSSERGDRSDVELFVDANGAYSRKEALAFAEAFSSLNVSWFEEPVSSDDLEGLASHSRSRAGRNGYHGRRIRIRPVLFSSNAGGRSGRRAAGRCVPLRNYRLSQGRRPVRGALSSAFQGIARRPFTFTRPAPPRRFGIWNISTITSASNRCCSTEPLNRRAGYCTRTSPDPAWGWNSNGRTLARTPCSIHGGRLCSVRNWCRNWRRTSDERRSGRPTQRRKSMHRHWPPNSVAL